MRSDEDDRGDATGRNRNVVAERRRAKTRDDADRVASDGGYCRRNRDVAVLVRQRAEAASATRPADPGRSVDIRRKAGRLPSAPRRRRCAARALQPIRRSFSNRGWMLLIAAT